MRVRHADVKADDFTSPKGRFGVEYREYINCEDTGCPFDLEHVTLKAGKRNLPFHSHGSLWELYYVLSGAAIMRTDEETVGLQAGDSYLCRPGLAHQIINDSDEDFLYLGDVQRPAA
jgi:mannose-6-phosphate isomerase-like protein (cupin superfamily)